MIHFLRALLPFPLIVVAIVTLMVLPSCSPRLAQSRRLSEGMMMAAVGLMFVIAVLYGGPDQPGEPDHVGCTWDGCD